jgi:hypothetical protein
MSESATKPVSSLSRRSRLWFAAVLCLPFFLLLLIWVYARWSGDRELDQLLAEIDREDPNWTQAHLERRPMPPPERNGMEQVLLAQAALARDWPTWPFPNVEDGPPRRDAREAMSASLEEISASVQFDSEQIRVLCAELKRADAAVLLARRLVEFPYGRFPLKPAKSFFSIMLNHVQQTRNVASLLRYDAYLLAHDGDIAGALHDVRALIHASRAIGDEPFVVSQLVRIHIDATAVATLQRVLGLGIAKDDDLKLVQALLLEEADTEFYLIGARGERALMDEFLASVYHREVTWTEFRRELGNTGLQLPGGGGILTDLFFFQAYAAISTQRAEVLAHMDNAVKAAKLPEPDRLAAFDELELQLHKPRPMSLLRIFGPFNFRAGEMSLRIKALLRSAAAGVAAERFRLVNDRWPASQNELVPLFLRAELKDPYDGKPLRFKRNNDGLVIYTLGRNLVDDGGKIPRTPAISSAEAPDSDVGFLLFDATKRRLPSEQSTPTPGPKLPPER